jgi:hypothetical protein
VKGAKVPAAHHCRFLRLVGAAVLLLAQGLAAAAGGQAPRPASGGWLESVQPGDFGLFSALWREEELAAHPELTRAARYHLRLELADTLKEAAGTLTVWYTNPGPEAVAEIPFFCYPNLTPGGLTVEAVTVAGRPVQPQAKGAVLCVPLPRPLPPGAKTTFTLTYALSVPESSEGGYGGYSFGQGVLSLAYAYPMIPARRAWERQAPARYGDFLTNEVAFYVVELSVPEGVVVAAPGVELRRHAQGGRTRLLFALGPARDLFLAAGRDLVVLEQKRGEVTVRSVAPRGCEEGARLVADSAHAALESYSRRFGPYPYTTLTLVGLPLAALGMEFPGIVIDSLRLYDLEGSLGQVPNRILLEATNAHEIAHQWFYGVVGNDQVQEPWIDESLAQYASWLYYRDRYGEEAAREIFREFTGRWERVQNAPLPIGQPVTAYSREEYGAIIYGRAPLFLHALAQHMGERSFDRFLAQLYRRHRWQLIDGRQLAAAAEEACGCELDELWEQWVTPAPSEPP